MAPQHRSRGAALTFLLGIYAALAKDGYCVVWGSVDPENVGARWVYRTSGSTVVRQQISRELCSRVRIQDARVERDGNHDDRGQRSGRGRHA